MANARRSGRNASGGSRKAFLGTLKRMGAVNFGTVGATKDPNVTRFWAEDSRGRRTEFNASTSGGMSAVNAKTAGKIRGSGSHVDKS